MHSYCASQIVQFKMNKYLKYTLTALIISAGIIAITIKSKNTEESSKTLTMSVRDYVLQSFLLELPDINKKLPYNIDDDTSLLNIDFKDNKVLFKYSLIKYKSNPETDQKIKDSILTSLKKQACEDEAKKRFIDSDIELINSYQDSNGILIFEFLTNKSNCSLTNNK